MSYAETALKLLAAFGLPRAQLNERSALTSLALLDLQPTKAWSSASSPLMGITPIMDWIREHYGKSYAPNTRETFRRQTMHQFMEAGIALYNPDNPQRSVNSPNAVYQIAPETLALLKQYGTSGWDAALVDYKSRFDGLAEKYAKQREMNRIPVRISEGLTIQLSPGAHSELIRAIIEEFAPRFAPDSNLIYAGDTADKNAYFDQEKLESLGVVLDSHGKMPDVVLHCTKRNWLLLVESVTSHGPVDAKRHSELLRLFGTSSAGIVYVTAFPTRSLLARYIAEIAWETEVWVADAPTHLIHFNGDRFLGPH